MSETARSQALIQALNKFKNSWTNTYIVIVIRYKNGYYFTYIASIQSSGNSFHVLEYSASYPTINIWNVTITLDNATISRHFSDDATVQTNTESYVYTASGEYSADCNDITRPGLHKNIISSTAVNSPGFYAYILVLRYKGYSDENLTQVAFPYNSSDPIKTRYRYSGAWSEWI